MSTVTDRTTSTLRAAARIYGARLAVTAAGTLGRDPAAQLFLRAGRQDPYPVYERLRQRGQLTESRLGMRVVTGHALASRILRDRRVGVRPPEDLHGPLGDWENEVDLSLLVMDPPEHTRLRRAVAPAFTPRRLAQFEQLITTQVIDLLHGLPRDEPFDLVSRFAGALPVRVIADLLGVPAADRAGFTVYGAAIAQVLDGYSSLAHRRRVTTAEDDLAVIFQRLFAERGRAPQDDLVTDLVGAEQAIRPEELVPLCRLLLVAGFETTVNLIGSTVLHLHRTGQWSLVAHEPTLAEKAIDETLRFDPPVQLTGRWAHEDLELDGIHVPRGAGMVVIIGATGRDPDVFARPRRYDLTREPEAEHLAFSAGIHYCLGAPLARMEARIAVVELARRFPSLRPAGPATPRMTTTLRGPLRLPVRV